MRKRIAVFASGFGSNLQAIMDFAGKEDLGGEISLVFSNKGNSLALKRARENQVKTACLDPSGFTNRVEFDRAILELLKSEKIDLVVLAGYMLLLSPVLVEYYSNRIINIHPALLPSFKGTHGMKDAFNYGVKVSGVTVHFVDSELDSGPIILQEAVNIKENDSLEDFEKRIHAVEHRIYPRAVQLFCHEKLRIEGRKVRILV
ncbi:MAG: phosphoribosylglycinamide formyltransferase [Actinobacteria bacterium]|nr:phosphoribosylglycinamide formyltransferase [Actinomycetota bacterium]